MPENPEKIDYRPIDYIIDVIVPAAEGEIGKGQVAINDRPAIIEILTHQIIKTGLIPPNQAPQDGLYRIDFSLYETTRFFKGAVPMADAAYGSIRTGIWIPFRAPIIVAGSETLHVAVQNMWGRAAPFSVQVIFKGLERMV